MDITYYDQNIQLSGRGPSVVPQQSMNRYSNTLYVLPNQQQEQDLYYVVDSQPYSNGGNGMIDNHRGFSLVDIESGGGVGLDRSINSPPYSIENNSNPNLLMGMGKSSPFSSELFHRPRGQGGKWLKIEENERVRVSPSTGKNLRMIISSTFSFGEKDIVIIPKNIIDDKEYERGNESIQIITFHGSVKQTDGFFYTQIDLKLFLQGQMMKLLVEVVNEGVKSCASTIQFSTHNSGKTNHTPKRRREESISIAQDEISIPIKEDIIKRQKVMNQDGSTNYRPSMFQNAQVIDSDLDVIGIIRARAFYQYSDIRLKTNIEELVDAMSIITSLSGKRFTWKEGVPFEDKRNPGKTVIGLLAQEVQKVAPEVVQQMDDGYLSVNYTELIPVIITAFNQLLAKVDKDKEVITNHIQELKDNIDVLASKDCESEKDKEDLLNKLNEVQKIVSCMKQEIDIRRSKNNLSIKKEEPKKRKIKYVVPIAVLLFIAVVVCTSIGVLFYKIYGESAAGGGQGGKKDGINPIYNRINDDDNQIINPSFEEVDSSELPFFWTSKSPFTLLEKDGDTRDGISIFPFWGNKSLQLTTLESRDSVLVTQTLLVAESPKGLNFSAWGNGDFFNASESFVPFMLMVELEASDLTKYVHTAIFNSTQPGWQFSYNFVEINFSLYAIRISCSISRGVGSVFFDNVSIVFS